MNPLVPLVVFVAGCALLLLEVWLITIVHHGRKPRRPRGSGLFRPGGLWHDVDPLDPDAD